MTYSSILTLKKNTDAMSEKFSDASDSITSTPTLISVSSMSLQSSI